MSDRPMLLLAACATAALPAAVTAAAAPPSPASAPAPAVVRVRFEEQLRIEPASAHCSESTTRLTVTWTGTATQTVLGPSRLPDGDVACTVAALRCEVRDGALVVTQQPDVPPTARPGPAKARTGPQARAGT